MPLDLEVNTGSFTPFIKYNAKAGRFFVKGDDGGELEIKPPTVAMDFEHIKVGWIAFNPGEGPSVAWDTVTRAKQPSESHKRGFRLLMNVPGHGVREMLATAGVLIEQIKMMYDHWESEGEGTKVPVWECTGVEPINSKHGTNYKPNFIFKRWTTADKAGFLEGAPPPIIGDSTMGRTDPGPQDSDQGPPMTDDEALEAIEDTTF